MKSAYRSTCVPLAMPPMIPRMGPFWTLANILSLSRLVLAVPISVLILLDVQAFSRLVVGLGIVAGLTDYLDGYVARRTNTITEWGKVLDPLADKVSVLAIGSAMVITKLLPLWLVGVIVLRDVLIVIGGISLSRTLGIVPGSLAWGKVAMTAAGITFLAAILPASDPIVQGCLWATTALMVCSFVQYLHRYLKLRTQTA